MTILILNISIIGCPIGVSIYRDVNDLSGAGIPVFRDREGFRLLDEAGLPPLSLTAAERASLLLALRNPAIERHESLLPAVRALRGKLNAGSLVMEEASRALRLAAVDRSGPVADEVAETLREGMGAGRTVRIRYRSLSGDAAGWRALDPYEVFHRGGAWYVVGRCHVHDEPRTFRLDRIARARLSESSFRRPKFDLDDYLGATWNLVHGRGTWDVVVHFDPSLAPLIDNARHHPRESKRHLPDGRIEYRVRVNALDEIARWIVGFGGKARAVEPEDLAKKVRDLASAVVVVHRASVKGTGTAVPGARETSSTSASTS